MDETGFGFLDESNLALFTDLYELTMMQGYFRKDHNPEAVFDLFFRDLPENRGYMIAAGLEQVVAYIENLEFTDRSLEYLREQGFDDEFLEYLEDFEFTGDVRAIPEGTPVFPNEPVAEVRAPLLQAQLLETMLINQVMFQSLIATKAVRMWDVVHRYGDGGSLRGDGQTLVDFGSRRAHGTDAGMKAARASFIGGFAGTSNVAGGEAFGIPVFGTMAHSWVQSFDAEREAFDAYMDVYGEDSILLVDTYDTMNGAELADGLVKERGLDIRGVRIDSGDLAELSWRVAERTDLDVFVSSGLDEYGIKRFFEEGGVADGFGVGTHLVTSSDAPKAEVVYKMVAVERDGGLRPEMKLSEGKVTYPGEKSVYRREKGGKYAEDVLALRGEDINGEDMLVDVFKGGTRVYDLPSLEEIQERTWRELKKLPLGVRKIRNPDVFEVGVGRDLRRVMDTLKDGLSQ